MGATVAHAPQLTTNYLGDHCSPNASGEGDYTDFYITTVGGNTTGSDDTLAGSFFGLKRRSPAFPNMFLVSKLHKSVPKTIEGKTRAPIKAEITSTDSRRDKLLPGCETTSGEPCGKPEC